MFGNCICSKSLDCGEISSLLNKTKETKFKNLRDSLSDPQSKISEFSNISNYSIKVNKERNKIQMKAIILVIPYECIATKIK